MLLFGIFRDPITALWIIVALLLAITIHEFSHAWMANFYGDPTAKLMGRLTLNPFAHLDLLGTIFLLIAGFGWGKPVIVNPRNFKNPLLDNITVSLAGPISNLMLSIVLGVILRFVPLPAMVMTVLELIIFFNLVLMIFNLIPIPPLDGSKILSLFVSENVFLALQQIGIFILFALVIFSSSIPIIPLLLTKGVGFFFTLITGMTFGS